MTRMTNPRHSLKLDVSQLEDLSSIFFRNTFSGFITREGVIIADTGCQNILVEGNWTTSVSRRTSGAIDTLTSRWPHGLRVRRP